jgi:cobalt-zinc-cadmium efflux system outer membrane protein
MTHGPFARNLHELRLCSVFALALLGGCTTYQSRPLLDEPVLATDLGSLQIPAQQLNHGTGGRQDVDLSDGLDLTEVGIVAVLNNRDLQARRAQLQVAGAQAFAAGLLPDPQFSAGFDRPTGNSAPVDAWSLGLSYDIIPLITRGARVAAADKHREQVRLDLLWQEWQVIQQARSLAVRRQLEDQRLALLRDMLALYQRRYQRSAQGLADGNITLDVNGTDLTALLDTFSQINQLEQTRNETRHALNLLLGLQPQAELALSPLPREPLLAAATVNARLSELPQVRPDLLALQAGYASQEAQVRGAILAQFPSLGIGVNRARYTSDVDTAGLSISLSLPLFSGNRGAIASERASREQLRAEYRARLAQTAVDVDRLLALQDIIHRQLANLQAYLPNLQTLVERARHAASQGDIDALTFLNMESTLVSKRLEQSDLTQSAWENAIALQALLALPDYPEKPLAATTGAGNPTPP